MIAVFHRGRTHECVKASAVYYPGGRPKGDSAAGAKPFRVAFTLVAQGRSELLATEIYVLAESHR